MPRKTVKEKVEARRTAKQQKKDIQRKEAQAQKDSATKETRQGTKKTAYLGMIAKEKGTPLEKLISAVSNMTDTAGFSEGKMAVKEDTPQTATGTTPSKTEKVKEKVTQGFKNIGNGVKDKAADIFTGWTEKLKHLESYGKIAEANGNAFGSVGEVSDLAGDILESAGKGDSKKSKSNRTVGAAVGFLSAIGSSVKFGCDMINEIKALIKGEAGNRDHRERWKAARGYMRDLVGILDGFAGAVGGVIKEIPIFGPILGICSGCTNFVLDFIDMIDNAVHVESMRKMRNDIYERMQQKRVKYSDAKHEDKAAAEAYTIEKGRHHRSEKVNRKRKDLLKTVYETEHKGTTDKGAANLRSKNDSKYRDAQLNLAQKIEQKKADANATEEQKKQTKSEKRQMEALQMMEEYREADKAHKKMSKALAHNLEDMLTGGIGIGLDITALIGTVSGVGIGVAVGAEATSYAMTGIGYVRKGAASGYKALRVFAGSEANKATTREDMAISLINKMEDISASSVWDGTSGFKTQDVLTSELDTAPDKRTPTMATYKAVVKQGRNVEHLHKILRNGLDASMSDLIASTSKEDLKGKIADCFGQG